VLGSLVYSQFLPGSSLLHRLDPRCKLLVLGLCTLGLFAIRSPAGQLTLALLVALTPIFNGIGLRTLRPPLVGVLPLALLTLIFQGFWGPPPHWGSFSQSGLEDGGLLALRLLILAVLAHLLALTTSPIAMCDAMEFLLSPLAWLRFPHRDLALAFTIAWRFLPVLARESDRLLKAQIARGAFWEEGPWHRRLLTLTGLLTPLLIRCFRYAEELAVALESRGYGQTSHPTRLYPLQWRWLDTGILVVCCGVLLGLGWGERWY